FNTFLTLLTTQLKNQDPTSPLDSNQFTQQLVQMTGVEQQLNANNLLQQLVNNTSSGVSTAVSLIGKQVKATSDTATLTGGQAQWTYNLPAGVADLKVQVVDSNGTIVNSVAPTDMGAGDHSFSWNGKDLTGSQLPDGGTYTLKVTAVDSGGNALSTSNYQQGVVTGVTQSNGQTFITVNGTPVNWSSIVSINQVASNSSTTNTNSGTTGS
ncbi:MAG: DUF4165 domain-containing protein, partial [Proteobacteria bacterium]|nr:DUF4165 domain-containing protein [Pseudomonadota bacterium]